MVRDEDCITDGNTEDEEENKDSMASFSSDLVLLIFSNLAQIGTSHVRSTEYYY